MKALLALLLACAVCLPALGQERPARERHAQKQGMQPREERRELRRERGDREERRRLSHEERRQLRQDLIDANREMRKGRR